MVRFSALLVIFTLAFGVASYAGETAAPSAYDLYIRATNAVTKEKSFKIRTDGEITTTTDGESVTENNLGFSAVIITDKGIEAMNLTVLPEADESINYGVSYLRDRVLYTESGDTKTKHT